MGNVNRGVWLLELLESPTKHPLSAPRLGGNTSKQSQPEIHKM